MALAKKLSPACYEILQNVMSAPDAASTTPLSLYPVLSTRSVYSPPCAHAHATVQSPLSRFRGHAIERHPSNPKGASGYFRTLALAKYVTVLGLTTS